LKRIIKPDLKAQQVLAGDGRQANGKSLEVLAAVGEWTAPRLETALKSYAETQGIKLGQLAQPLRAALTGTTVSPGIFDVLEVLGREESLARIKDQSA
jgi:glutamyl-tRNA synthetase